MNLTIESLPKLVENTSVFLGAKESPLLAPRGVFLVNNKLIVADTAQNRVFVWNDLPKQENEKPDIVLGQAEKLETGRNASGKVNASSLFYENKEPELLQEKGKYQKIPKTFCHIQYLIIQY